MSQEPQDDLDALVRRVDPERWLSSRFIADVQARADVIALYAYDHELARAPKAASNPLMGEIRLTWWREVLDEVFEARAVRRHPTAQALADVVRRHDLPRGPLEAMIDARYRELDPAPMSELETLDWARETGGLVAQVAVTILDPAAGAMAAVPGAIAWTLSWRLATAPDLAGAFPGAWREARKGARRLSAAAFPAVAHAALAPARARGRVVGDLARQARLTLAVALGRI